MRSSTVLSVLLLAVSAIAVPIAVEEPQQYDSNLDAGLEGPEIGSITDGGELEERTLSRSGAIKRPPGQNIGSKKATAAAAKPTAAADDDAATIERIRKAFSRDISDGSDDEELSDLEERTLSRSGAIKRPPGQNIGSKKATAAAVKPTAAADDDAATIERIRKAFSRDIDGSDDEELSDLEERTLSRNGAIKKPPGQNVKSKLDAKKATAAAAKKTAAVDPKKAAVVDAKTPAAADAKKPVAGSI